MSTSYINMYKYMNHKYYKRIGREKAIKSFLFANIYITLKKIFPSCDTRNRFSQEVYFFFWPTPFLCNKFIEESK